MDKFIGCFDLQSQFPTKSQRHKFLITRGRSQAYLINFIIWTLRFPSDHVNLSPLIFHFSISQITLSLFPYLHSPASLPLLVYGPLFFLPFMQSNGTDSEELFSTFGLWIAPPHSLHSPLSLPFELSGISLSFSHCISTSVRLVFVAVLRPPGDDRHRLSSYCG